MIFLTINGILINAAEVQTARTVTEADVNGTAGTKVWFINDGWAVIPDITVEQFEALLADAVKAAAPF
jgi:hypothetical protein